MGLAPHAPIPALGHPRIIGQQTWERPDERKHNRYGNAASGTSAQALSRDPFHGAVVAGDGEALLDFGIHRAIGGDHDLQNPGDMLCAALAACLDSTLRMIAVRMGIALKTLAVEVRAFADVRGCLVVDRQVPVGFQRIDVDVFIEAEGNTDPAQISRLTSVAERCCVVLQTLRSDIAVDTRFRGPATIASAE
jgi:uncharacterized OsmC-like protein